MKTLRRDAGFSLAALIFFTTAASIFIAAAVPAYQMQAKREVEEELIFRGEEYVRGIQKYQRKFGIYPTSVDQLVETNGLRFIRRKYKDPVTGKDFRVITVNPDGSVNGSKLFAPNNSKPLLENGAIPTFGQPQAQTPGGRPPTPQTPQAPQTPFLSGGGAGQLQPLGGRPQTPQTPSPSSGPRGLGGGNQPTVSGGIIGVASDSDKDSIKVYNKRQKYDEWEFVAILGQGGQANPANPALPQPGANPGNPLAPPRSPTAAPGANPFGPGNIPAPTNPTRK